MHDLNDIIGCAEMLLEGFRPNVEQAKGEPNSMMSIEVNPRGLVNLHPFNGLSFFIGSAGSWCHALLLALLGSIALGCSTKDVSTSKELPKSSIYSWKSTADVSTDWYLEYRPHRMYVKYLDLAHRSGISVKATNIKSLPPAEIIPVIFVDYRLLARHKVETIIKHIERTVPVGVFAEIQLDCDWTLSTKDAYFKLLKLLKKNYPVISATIRLHQVKYFKKTGVPPVNRGVLMYYNMSTVEDFKTKNYILDLEVAKAYHVNFDAYPIPLDLALPLYRQARVFRDEALVGLIHSEDLDHTALSEQTGSAGKLFTVTRGHYAGGRFLYEGDQLKVDRVSTTDLLAAAKGLKTILRPREVIYFEQSSTRHFTPWDLKRITRVFGE